MYGQTDKIFNKIMEKSTKVKLRFFCQVEFESGLTWKDLQFHLFKKKKLKNVSFISQFHPVKNVWHI